MFTKQEEKQREQFLKQETQILTNIFHLHYPHLNIKIDQSFANILDLYEFIVKSEWGNKVLKDPTNLKALRKSLGLFFSAAIDSGLYDGSWENQFVTKVALYNKIKQDRDNKLSKIIRKAAEEEPIQPYLDYFMGVTKRNEPDQLYFSKFKRDHAKIQKEYDRDLEWFNVVTQGIVE